MVTPRATYRFQFHKDFPLAKAEELVPYLDRLGISHVYASPITVAVPGSQHGYDVVDPTRVNPELGGEAALRSLVAELRERGMGLIIDIVPNHMGVAGGHNAWWNDVLRNGQASQFAKFFDIDWRSPVMLPILGAPLSEVLAEGHIAIDRTGDEPVLTVYGEHRVPLRPDDNALPDPQEPEGIARLLDKQHYQLAWWRQANDELNWRRFFTISELAGLRIEDDAVFEATHALYFRLWEEGLIDGVRIDHVDGLSDPTGYCRKLRERFETLPRDSKAPEGPAYIVVEKILAPGETLPGDWRTNGTSGYDFMEDVSALLHDPAGAQPLERLWRNFSGRELSFHEEELRARKDMLSWSFEAQLHSCVEAFHALASSAPRTAGLTKGMLRRALERLLWVFPVYRTYGTGSNAPESDAEIRERVRRDAAAFTPPGEAEVADRILAWLAGEGPGDAQLAEEAVRRFQQLSAPIAAKAVEDTAFYRYAPLLSRLDVGFDASRMASTIGEFHAACEIRAQSFPHSMLATATHDHKRGEDVRARLAVLSALPEIWADYVAAWDRNSNGPDSGLQAGDRYALYQMAFGSWPDGLTPDDTDSLAAYAQRLSAWQEKALREGKLRSSWEHPDSAYEQRAKEFVNRLLDPSQEGNIVRDMSGFVQETSGAALANMLVQAALRYTVPGMPDCYQGCELPDFSMVDPDNRRPVDFARRGSMLGTPAVAHPKLSLIAQLLDLRRRQPPLLSHGTYRPAEVSGPRADRVIAFTRAIEGAELYCAFAVRCAEPLLHGSSPTPPAAWWEGTQVLFSQGQSENAADLFAESPVAVRLVEKV
ncbi:malto-oligosyltrehalose synthase [Aurantiacibacter poecillastricola]|uniref:malto-oligosyltrehalose synthase n=1 Tax=Aurantiacibacter poecillastricola TaxID=3064385 RepID=UPI00273FCF1A|nr:malto-oligosyltrehalose synthase [Aurantiacibacter sp. 219JJ12-13]MDP5261315.1 malto-oligosyltrehalose synthase [Aurantiacibacter sp. 219JJ12-13]